MEKTKVVDYNLVKLGFIQNAPISVDVNISNDELKRLIKLCEEEQQLFLKNPKWNTPKQIRFEGYCDFLNFLSKIKKEAFNED